MGGLAAEAQSAGHHNGAPAVQPDGPRPVRGAVDGAPQDRPAAHTMTSGEVRQIVGDLVPILERNAESTGVVPSRHPYGEPVRSGRGQDHPARAADVRTKPFHYARRGGNHVPGTFLSPGDRIDSTAEGEDGEVEENF